MLSKRLRRGQKKTPSLGSHGYSIMLSLLIETDIPSIKKSMESKSCGRCKAVKPIADFYNDRNTKTGYSSYCKPCIKLVSIRYINTPSMVRSRRRAVGLNRTRIRALFNVEKAKYKCLRCGESHPACLDFHHRNPAEKFRNVSEMVCSAFEFEKILEEMAKCDCLCSNCHRKEHWGSVGKNKPSLAA